MSFRNLKFGFIGALLFSTAAYTADCEQPRPDASQEAGDRLSAIIYHNNWLNILCNPKWSDDLKSASSNRGSVRVYITREDTSKDLVYCQDAINNIIDQCIKNGPYDGGTWSLNGETYKIYNDRDAGNTGPITAPPPSATILTETIQGSTYTVTYTPSTVTAPVTTSTENSEGVLVPVIIPIGGLIWWIFGVPPAGVPVTPPPSLPTGGGGDGNPDDNCVTSTASRCVQTCTPVVQQQITSMSCQDPSCTATVGCSVTATTSTVTATPTIVVGDEMEIIEVPTYEIQQVLGIQAELDGELGVAVPPTQTQPAVPIKDLPCQQNVANEIPEKVPVGGTDVSINDLIYGIRQQICAGPCTAPEGVDKKYVAIYPHDGQWEDTCEISVGITDQVEAYFIRETKPDGDQWQQCWDATEMIINKCIKNGPNTGWWNGDHVYQFYQGGLRPLNGGGAKHTDQITAFLGTSPSTTLQPQPAPGPTLSAIYPTKFDGSADCLDRSDGAGTDTTSLFWTEGSAIVMGQRLSASDSMTLSTSDPSKCISHGQVKNDQGAILNNWCVAYTDGDAAFVIADKYQDWGNGATGQSEIKGKTMMDFAKWAREQCGGTNKAVAGMGGQFSLGQSLNSICIVNKAHPETCQINWGING